MIRTLFAVVAVSVAAASCPAKDVDPNPKSLEIPAEVDGKARELIRAFTKSSYAEREQAHRELKELGRSALPALLGALANNSNPEVQLRCEMLLPLSTAADMKLRVDCFLADAKNEYDHKLPGAKEYFAIVGKSEASRNLFRDLILSPNQAMLFAVGGKPDDLAKAIVTRRNQFQPYYGGNDGTGRPNPTAADIAAILFAESQVSEKLMPRNASQVSQFINQPVLRTALDSGPNKEIHLALMAHWVDTREEAITLYYAMTMSTNFKLPTGMNCAKKLLAIKGGPPSYRGYAVVFIGKTGKPEDAELLEPLLKDKSIVATTFMAAGPGGNKRIPVQTRDVALAMCALLRKQDPADYGLLSRTKSTNDVIKYNITQHYFDDADGDADKKRDDAVKKYEDWKATEKKKS